MCYEKPGKRCFSHAADSLEKKKERSQKLADKYYNEILPSGNQPKIDAFAAKLRDVMQTELKAQIDYDATDVGLEELYDMKEELVMVGVDTTEIDRRIQKGQARAAWQVDTYTTLKEIENNDGFGKIYALEDAARYAAVELEVEKEKLRVAKHLHEGAKQQLAELAIKDLTSYIKTTNKKIKAIKDNNADMRRIADKYMEGKKIVTIYKESE